MDNQDQILIAWTISQLITRLNELIWDQYEKEFANRYIKLEDKNYSETQTEKNLLSNPE